MDYHHPLHDPSKAVDQLAVQEEGFFLVSLFFSFEPLESMLLMMMILKDSAELWIYK